MPWIPGARHTIEPLLARAVCTIGEKKNLTRFNNDTVDATENVASFDQINVWKRGDEHAPHEPLLLLLALSRCARGEGREIPYCEVDKTPPSGIQYVTFGT